MDWAKAKVPVYVAGYGPRALTLAGKVADGVVFQVADPYFIEWGLQFVRQGAEEAGRGPGGIRLHSSAAADLLGELARAPDPTRLVPAAGRQPQRRRPPPPRRPGPSGGALHVRPRAAGLRLPPARPSRGRPQQVRPRRDL